MSYTVWFVVRRTGDIAAVQDSLDRAWEISFWGGGEQDRRPRMLPEGVDRFVDSTLQDIFWDTSGYGPPPAYTRNRAEIHHDRFQALFRKPIDEIHIYYPESLRGDLPAALARFPRLRRFTLYENEPLYPTKVEWTRLCTALRSFPNLEEIELGGAWITDSAIAPLAGHPRLRVVEISGGRLTAKCTETFASMPNLTKLHIEEQMWGGNTWPSAAEQEAMRVALPKVTLKLSND